jgi:N-acetyl-anhydromuramyl-L-alanine amidase AmpD
MNLSGIPYREAANWSKDLPAGPKRLIVIHAMEYPERVGAADWCARYFAGEKAPQASAHACVDAGQVIQCVPWDRVAWHAPGANRFGIGIEHAGFSNQTVAEWQDAFGMAMLGLSSQLVAQLCVKFTIPVDFLDAAELLAAGDKASGITTHAQVNLAFKKSDHMDPGRGFPMGDYLKLVSAQVLNVGLQS